MSKSPINKIQSIPITQENPIVLDTNQYPPFSIAMSVYIKDNAAFFDSALASVINQSLKPSEIVLVVDGPVHDSIQKVIEKYSEICIEKGIRLITNKLDVNGGLGNSLRIAVEIAAYDIIARMDSDDIASFNRFELQLEYMLSHPDVDIVGGQIIEFLGSFENIVGKRVVPTSDIDLKYYLKYRCPFNHMTVMFKKKEILMVGNYLDWPYNEDFYLWIRMALAGCIFANLPDTLVYARVGKDMYDRRGGWRYFKSEVKLQRFMLTNKVICLSSYIYNVIGRFIIQVLMPNKLRGFIFQKLFRNL